MHNFILRNFKTIIVNICSHYQIVNGSLHDLDKKTLRLIDVHHV